MGTTPLILVLAASLAGSPIPKEVVKKQDSLFQRYWGTDFEWKFEELPTKAMVPKFRVPYSGYIYPDTGGGTTSVMRKYDLAFHGGRYAATSWEQWDSSLYRREGGGGLFGLFRRSRTPSWYGHCNGWTAAAIRHAEPQKSVTVNGVRFSPSDIKGLLAEIYIYNDTENLTGDYRMNAGTFHAVLANWLGRGAHPLGMEADPSEERWNYPIYSYAYSFAKRRNRRVEVKMNVAYTKDLGGEYNEAPRNRRIKYFHYMLELDRDGKIVGGSFLYDSSIIDLLWVPLRPKASGRQGNERGNPYVDVNKVLAIWRASVDEETRKKWPVIDPAPEDRILDVAAIDTLIPVQDPDNPPSRDPVVREPSEPKATPKVAKRPTTGAAASETPASEAGRDSADAEAPTTAARRSDNNEAVHDDAETPAETAAPGNADTGEPEDSMEAEDTPEATEPMEGEDREEDMEDMDASGSMSASVFGPFLD